MTKVCHLTSVHHRNDTRIFHKELPALAEAAYDVCIVVADGKGDEQRPGYFIYDVGSSANRLQRISLTTKKVFSKAMELDADIYHFHDPELIPVGLKLIKAGEKVIYDVHEDVPRDIMSKDWLPGIAIKPIASWFEKYENRSAPKFNYIITATPFIQKRFKSLNKQCVTINNYPILDELITERLKYTGEMAVCYIGEITRIRAAEEMIKAMENVNAKFLLAGHYENDTYRNKLSQVPGWNKVKEFGFVNRSKAREILSQSSAGLVIFHPEPNHINAQPNKIFEYMSAGVPVIGSNFPLWKEIIEGNKCGICVDPLQPKAIEDGIKYILNNPDKAQEMGENGRKAVESRYNWEHEKTKLVNIYKQLER